MLCGYSKSSPYDIDDGFVVRELLDVTVVCVVSEIWCTEGEQKWREYLLILDFRGGI